MDIQQTVRLAQRALDDGRLVDAATHLRAAVQLAPRIAPLWNELGTTLARLGEIAEAADAFRQAIVIQPNNVDAQANLALALFHLHQLDEAEVAYRAVLSRSPNDPAALFGLGTICERRQQFEDARRWYESAITSDPRFGDAYINLGNVLWELGEHNEAQVAMGRALALNPDSATAARNMGVLLLKAGLVDRAIAQYRGALARSPGEADAMQLHSSLLFAMFYQWPYSPESHFDEHVRWAQRFADPLTATAAPHTNDRNPDRRLRIGYLSPDFRAHPVGTFLEPVLANHDRAQFEVYCYSNVTTPDEVTARFRSLANVWREISALPDSQVAQQIRDDQIDLLIELTGHTGGNRLLVFARKPAPIQIAYLGYMATTGMRAIDHRITDAHADPPGRTERFHSEQLVRLPEAFFCYQPPGERIDVPTELPKHANGYVTFASSNRLIKVNADVMIAWARILNGVEHSQLWLLSPGSRDAAERCLVLLEQHGVARSRVELLPNKPFDEYLRTLGQIDIALDSFPISGHTTTCHTLWMGTPVVTLAGETYVSRLGASVMENLGLPELVAHNVDEYVQIAVDLARDDGRLARLRRELRGCVEARLANGPRTARHLEAAYRTLWRSWCDRSR